MSFSALRNSIDRKVADLTGTVSSVPQQVERQFTQFSNNIRQGAEQVAGSISTELTQVAGATFGSIVSGAVAQVASTLSGYPGNILPPSGPSSGYRNFQPGQQPPWNNELEPYASYNTIFTLSVLSIEEYNNPDETYVASLPKNILVRSGGGAGPNKVKTAYEANGQVEYYIDDVQIESIIAPGSTTGISNGSTVTFTIREPYSLGMFVQAMLIGANRAGYENYTGVPFLLTIEFKGWDEDNNTNLSPFATRRIPLHLVKATTSADEGGCVYNVRAIVSNGMAFYDEMQTIKNDVSITGEDLITVLQTGTQSLATSINLRYQENEITKQDSTADRIIIQIPEDLTSGNASYTTASVQRATVSENEDENIARAVRSAQTINGDQSVSDESVNAYREEYGNFRTLYSSSDIAQRKAEEARTNVSSIGREKLLSSFADPGEMPYALPDAVWDEEKKVFVRTAFELQIDEWNRNYHFTAGTKIEHIIQQMVLISGYAKKLLDQLAVTSTSNGMVKWFRIESQVYFVRDQEQYKRRGTLPKVYVYRVVPYEIHHSFFMGPSRESQGLSFLKAQAAKEYNYIYTGQNKDVLDFKLEFNHAFYVNLEANLGNTTSQERSGHADGAIAQPNSVNRQQGPGPATTPEGEIAIEQNTNEGSNVSGATGSAHDTPEDRAARSVHNAFLNSDVDLIRVDLTIKGDPYYIPNSGFGNYVQADSNHWNMKLDGSINYQNGEVFVNLIFRTPIDYNDNGTMDFVAPQSKDSEVVDGFSGVYRVIKVKHSWDGNMFTQNLTLLRYRNQTDSSRAEVPVLTRSNSLMNSANRTASQYNDGR